MACGFLVGKNSKVDLEIKGNVVFKGGLNEDGIRVEEGATINIYGDGNLYCSGNNEKEYIGIAGYDNTDDKSVYGTGGSGIGNAGATTGTINITGLSGLTAKGYGRHAHGIGGGLTNINISNCKIDYVRGGFPSNLFLNEDKKYGKQEPEGGCAIGIGLEGGDHYGVINFTNVVLDKAEGGSKSSAIGASYWNSATVNIKDSTLKEVIGGNASAAIGGSRVRDNDAHRQIIDIKIIDSKVENALGGEHGAGIGNGYDTRCSSDPSKCNIEITGNSDITAKGGKYGAGIGTGFHTGNLTGFIDASVKLNASRGDIDFYKDSYTTAQDIGYAVVDPARDVSQETVTFKVAGELIEQPW